MKRVRYTKYKGSLADDLDLESLLEALSNELLDSGFPSPFGHFREFGEEQTLDDLSAAIDPLLA